MRSFYEFVEKNKITYPPEMEDMLLSFYFRLKLDIMQEINHEIFGEIVDFAKMTKQVREMRNGKN